LFSLLNSNSDMAMQKSLDALWLKQKVISDNLANIDTPGFKSRRVIFESVLQNVLKQTSAMNGMQEKLSSLHPKVVTDQSTQMRQDGNNVDAEEQNIELAKAQLQYEMAARLVSEDFSRMKYAINEGRG